MAADERPLEYWFSKGGDHRLVADPATGLTPYRVALCPRNSVSLGSCTASSPGPRGWSAAHKALDEWNASGGSEKLIEGFVESTRSSLRAVMGLSPQVSIPLAPSGTDILYLVSQIARRGFDEVHHVIVGASELGGGTVSASKGLTFSARTPFGGEDAVGREIPGLAEHCSVESVYLRKVEGQRLDDEKVDAEVESRVNAAMADGRRVVLHLVVHSKTGLRAPSMEAANRLKARHGESLLVLIDAAQGRIAPADVQRAISAGFVVLFTGSKFYSGPPFCGALFLPESLSGDPGPFPAEISLWYDRASLPEHWSKARASLENNVNVGLALRWVAAAAEFTAYHEILPRWRGRAYATFAGAVHENFGPSDVVDMEIPLPPGHRLVTVLGAFPTVFSFRVRGKTGWLDASQLKRLHALLDTDLSHEDPRLSRCYHLGQPVALGPPGQDRRAYLRVALGCSLVTEFSQQPDAGGAWMREQMAGIRIKIETLIHTGRFQE